ncbi:MAG: S24 family peptidase [Thermoanaerobaculia bacterium]
MATVAADTIAELLSRGHSVRFVATGDSMYPLIRSDESLLVEPAEPDSIRRGDVVLSRTSRGLTAHRVIAISRADSGLRFQTRGDNAPGADEPFGESELLGVVVGVERDGRMRERVRATGARLKILRFITRARAAISSRFSDDSAARGGR